MARTHLTDEDAKFLNKFKTTFHVTGKGYGEAITKLIEKFREAEKTIKTLRRTLEQTQQENDSPTVPLVPPEETQAPPTFEHECEFYTFIDDQVNCSKDFDAKGIIHRVPEEICLLCWTRIRKAMDEDQIEASQFPCLCRYENHGQWFCLLHPPRPRYLQHGLKTCVACAERLSEERAEQKGLRLTTKYFPSCKPKERKIGTDRQLKTENFDCPFSNQWISMSECLRVKCSHLKSLKVRF